MKNGKKPVFKRGDEIMCLNPMPYSLRLVALTVTATRGTDTVYAQHVDQNGNKYKYTFTNDPELARKQFTHALWTILHHPGKKMFNRLEKRLRAAERRHAQYRETAAETEREVNHDARAWMDEQYRERMAGVPYGADYVQRVIARAGFRRPKG